MLCFTGTICFSQNQIFGKWKTIDDNTGKPRSIVEIFEKNGQAHGKVVQLFREPGEELNPVCNECDDDDPRKDQPVIGMEIIKAMERDDDEWGNGEILDPENGNIYDCKIWVEDGKLQVRGYIAFFFRTQTWFSAE